RGGTVLGGARRIQAGPVTPGLPGRGVPRHVRTRRACPAHRVRPRPPDGTPRARCAAVNATAEGLGPARSRDRTWSPSDRIAMHAGTAVSDGPGRRPGSAVACGRSIGPRPVAYARSIVTWMQVAGLRAS